MEFTLLCAAMPLVEVPSNENEEPCSGRRVAGVMDEWQGYKGVSLRTATE